MLMKILLVLWLIFSLVFAPVAAQDDLQPITPQNAADVVELATLGRGWIRKILWSPDGHTLAVVSSIGVWLYNAADFSVEPILLPAETEVIHDVVFTPDGRLLVHEVDAYEVKIFEIPTGTLLTTFRANLDRAVFLGSLSLSADGTQIHGSDRGDGTQWFWDTTTFEAHSTPPAVWYFYNPDGTVLAVQNMVEIRLIITVNEQQFGRIPLRDPKTEPESVFGFSQNGRYLLTHTTSGPGFLWDIQNLPRSVVIHGERFATNADSSRLLTVLSDWSVALWNFDTGEYITTLLNGLAGPGDDCHRQRVVYEFSLDGSRIITGNENGQTWDVPRGVLRYKVEEGYFATLSLDGSEFVTIYGASAFTVSLRRVQDGAVIAETLHPGSGEKVSFNETGTLLLIVGNDLFPIFTATVSLWDMTNEPYLLDDYRPGGHIAPVMAGKFSQDERLIITGGHDGTVRLGGVR